MASVTFVQESLQMSISWPETLDRSLVLFQDANLLSTPRIQSFVVCFNKQYYFLIALYVTHLQCPMR